MNGEQLPVMHIPHNSLRGLLNNQERMHQEGLAAKRRRKLTLWASTVLTSSALIATSLFIALHEQQIDHDSKEIAALVKEQGYVDAKAIKPTDNKAYITLWMRGCETGQPDIAVDNVTATLQETPTGTKLEFSRKSGEEKVAGHWVDITQIWKTREQFCAQEASK